MNDRVPFTPDKEEPSIPVNTNPLVDPEYKGLTTFMDDINYHSMAESFDVSYEDRRDPKMAEKLSYLADWAKEESKSEEIAEQKLTIKKLAKALGYQSTGPTLITKLYQYARLDQDRRRIDKEMEVLQA